MNPTNENTLPATIPPLRAEITLAPECITALALELARQIIGFLLKLLHEAQAAQEMGLMTPEEVAQYFRVNLQWVYEWTSRNELPHIKVGKYLRFYRQEIEQLAAGMVVPVLNKPPVMISGLQIGSNRFRRKRITLRGRATADNPSPGQ